MTSIRKTKQPRLVAVTLTALSLSACGAPEADVDDPSALETVGQEFIIIAPPAVPVVQTWSSGQPRIYLAVPTTNPLIRTRITTKSHVCGLIKFWGDFGGGARSITLASTDFDNNVGGNWFIEGNLAGAPGGATVRCEPLGKFSRFTKCFGGAGCASVARLSIESGHAGLLFPSGDAITALTSVSGRFDGGDEWVVVRPVTGRLHDPYIVEAHQSSLVRMTAGGTMTHLGRPVDIRSYSAAYTNLFSTGMGPKDTQFCYLTRISGKFRGGGEWVEIKDFGSTTLSLEARASGSQSTFAQANCVSF
jgi:hypothetical protein